MRLVFFFFFTFSLIANAQKTKKNCAELYENKDLKEAFECYSFLADSLNDYYQCAKIAGELGDSKSKKTWAKNMLKIFSEYPSTYYLLAQLEDISSKDYDKQLNKGLKKYPKDTLLMDAQLTYHFVNKHHKQALESVDKMLKIEPRNADYHATKGFVLDGLGRDDEAIKSFEKCVSIDLKHFESNYFLGLAYYESALEKVTESNEVSDSLSYNSLTKESLKYFELAYPHLEEIYAASDENKDITKFLLKCYLRLGKMEEYRLLLDDQGK
ncbi:MAG: hypothetical protein BM555_06450 [Crocinitomix sp. MedPE-SWsnd]|jgi:tetratricopeptide (TPR) repeat protein|nr:MAG: hypothetical protein BM555_06450 [Crocinitomix sp. MedPE-SWsnd]